LFLILGPFLEAWPSLTNRPQTQSTITMRVYEDTFSGAKIYPGKVGTFEEAKDDKDQELTQSTGQALRPGRFQDLPFPERQIRVSFPPAQEPSQDRMDRSLPQTAQEGYL